MEECGLVESRTIRIGDLAATTFCKRANPSILDESVVVSSKILCRHSHSLNLGVS